jgi:2-dehydropantoate 2-reductase
VGDNGWPQIVVVGAGAVGSYFGGMLARAGAPITLVGREQHAAAIGRHGLYIDSLDFQQYVTISATSEVSAARNAKFVLFCVKTYDNEQAAQTLAAHLTPGAVVVSLQNGVDNVERIRSAAGMEAIAAVVYVAVAMAGPGRVKHSGRGDLIIGNLLRDGSNRQADLDACAKLFARAGIPCRISENIEAELWTKMIINCAYNAISALGRAKYARLAQNQWTRDLMIRVTEEALAVAVAAGVHLPETNIVEDVLQIAETMSGATSSTAQDIARGRRTEIDSLNGYLVRRGAELGVAVPANQTLHALVKLLEETAAGSGPASHA